MKVTVHDFIQNDPNSGIFSRNVCILPYETVNSLFLYPQLLSKYHENSYFKGFWWFSGFRKQEFEWIFDYHSWIPSIIHRDLFFRTTMTPVSSEFEAKWPLCGSFCVISNHMWGISLRKSLKTRFHLHRSQNDFSVFTIRDNENNKMIFLILSIKDK